MGGENFLKKAFLPPNPQLSKTFEEKGFRFNFIKNALDQNFAVSDNTGEHPPKNNIISQNINQQDYTDEKQLTIEN